MKSILLIVLLFSSNLVFSGTDLSGKISRVWLHPSGNLYLKMDNTAFDAYCKKGWYGFNVMIPKSSPEFPYYYGLVLSAQAKNQTLYLANFSVFDGSTYCDITKTNYGIVVQSQ